MYLLTVSRQNRGGSTHGLEHGTARARWNLLKARVKSRRHN